MTAYEIHVLTRNNTKPLDRVHMPTAEKLQEYLKQFSNISECSVILRDANTKIAK